MAVAISISFSAESRAVIDRWQEAPQQTADALSRGVDRILADIENHLKTQYFRGGPGAGGGRSPVGVRSGALRQAVNHEKTEPFAGFVGTSEGVTTPYAQAILGDQDTTITPQSAKHLWIPIADNLTPTGQTRFTPRALFDQFGKKNIHIFTSKKGNKVVFAATGGRFKRRTQAGRTKGDLKGKLMFVLKDRVVIHGTDALARAAEDRRDRMTQIIDDALKTVNRK